MLLGRRAAGDLEVVAGLSRVLAERTERGRGELRAAVDLELEPGHYPEPLRVPLEGQEVRALALGEGGHRRHSELGVEEGGDGVLSRVTERRVADVVRQAGRRDHVTHVVRVELRVGADAMPLAHGVAHALAERPAHRGHLQAVGEPRVHDVVLGEREDLRLVVETPEGAGEEDAIPVALEVAPRDLRRGVTERAAIADAFAGEEPSPVHGSVSLTILARAGGTS